MQTGRFANAHFVKHWLCCCCMQAAILNCMHFMICCQMQAILCCGSFTALAVAANLLSFACVQVLHSKTLDLLLCYDREGGGYREGYRGGPPGGGGGFGRGGGGGDKVCCHSLSLSSLHCLVAAIFMHALLQHDLVHVSYCIEAWPCAHKLLWSASVHNSCVQFSSAERQHLSWCGACGCMIAVCISALQKAGQRLRNMMQFKVDRETSVTNIMLQISFSAVCQH